MKTFATVCSGIGAPEVAFTRLGWRSLFCSEIEKFPCAVLAHHFPNTTNYGDLTKFHEWPRSTPDVLCAGTPCQSFSVAGLRAGMDDPRGNLALVFLGLVDRLRPRWVLYENVPGLHSSWIDETESAPSEESCRLIRESGFNSRDFVEVEQTNDFDCFTAALAELGYGVATRIFDAQFFGLAQRRERVFVVGHIGGQWQRAAAVLFDRAGLCGDPAPCRQAGQGTTGTIEAGAGRCRGAGQTPENLIAPTISARTKGGGGLGTDFDLDGGLIAPCITQNYGKQPDNSDTNSGPMLITATLTKNYATHYGCTAGNNGGVAENQLIAGPLATHHTPRGHGCAGVNNQEAFSNHLVPTVIAHGQGNAEKVSDGEPSLTCNHEAPILFDTTQVTSKTNRSNPQSGDPCHTLAEGNHAPAIAIQEIGKLSGVRDQNGSSVAMPGDPMFTLQSGAQHGVAFQSSQSGVREQDVHATLDSNNGSRRHNGVIHQMAVRRLTPIECERLQGFPDNWTQVPFRGKPAADGPRYKAIGNSMAVPCIEWIGRRMDLVDKLVPFSVDTLPSSA